MENILWVLWFWAEGDEVLDDEVWDDELEDDDVDHTVCDAQEEGVLFYKEFNQISILNSIHCLWRLSKPKMANSRDLADMDCHGWLSWMIGLILQIDYRLTEGRKLVLLSRYRDWKR